MILQSVFSFISHISKDSLDFKNFLDKYSDAKTLNIYDAKILRANIKHGFLLNSIEFDGHLKVDQCCFKNMLASTKEQMWQLG